MPTRTLRIIPAPLVLAAAAFIAILPMLVHGPSCGHDFDFHILSWLEAATQFAHFGFPHWAYTPAYNAGEPRFVFYPPLSWALGAFLGLILPWNFVPAAFTWIALTLSGLTMHRLARRHAAAGPALLAATLYLANPYMLFTAYERTAYGELLAAAWLPLLFAAALATRPRILPIAIAVALLWLTNAPAAVMACYALAFLTLIRLLTPRSSLPSSLFPRPSSLALSTTAGTLLGLTLAAFYILPAAYEQRFVQVNMAVIPGMRPQEHFLFHRMGSQSFDDLFHDQVVRTASIIALTLLAAIAVALLTVWRKKPSLPSSLFPLPFLTLLIAFLLTPPSLFLWNHIPKLAFLQFPWRLTALLAVILALTTARALSRLKHSLPFSLFPLPLALLLVLPAWHLFAQHCDYEDTVPARVALFHSNLGTEATDEYTPIHVDGDALKPNDPPYWLIPMYPPKPPAPARHIGMDVPAFSTILQLPLSDNTPPPAGTKPGQAPDHLNLDLAEPEYLVLNRRAYPFWHIVLNGKTPAPLPLRQLLRIDPIPITYDFPPPQPPKRSDGLIVLTLPAGHSTVDLVYCRPSDQTLGPALSALALLATLTIRRKKSLTLNS